MSGEGTSANGAMLSPTPQAIEVAGGAFLDLLNPAQETLSFRSIARGLANTCRYGGQINRFYSVAEHSVLVHDLLRHLGAEPNVLRAGLFHDAAEAYLHDITAPLKWALRYTTAAENAYYHGPWPPDGSGRSAYDVLSDRMDGAVEAAFDVDLHSTQDAVRLADLWALRIESRALSDSGGRHWRWTGELPNGGELPVEVSGIGGLTPDDARVLWLDKVGAPVSAYEDRDDTGA